MKTTIFASMLLMGSAAIAQTVTPADNGKPIGSGATIQQGTTMGERDTMGTNAAVPTPDGQGLQRPNEANTSTMTTTTGSSTMSTGSMDSSTGTATGTMGTTGSGTTTTTVETAGNMAPAPEPRASYPRCSRTVTDNCVQSEARARDTRRSRR